MVELLSFTSSCMCHVRTGVVVKNLQTYWVWNFRVDGLLTVLLYPKIQDKEYTLRRSRGGPVETRSRSVNRRHSESGSFTDTKRLQRLHHQSQYLKLRSDDLKYSIETVKDLIHWNLFIEINRHGIKGVGLVYRWSIPTPLLIPRTYFSRTSS